jgi:hypothetical protein
MASSTTQDLIDQITKVTDALVNSGGWRLEGGVVLNQIARCETKTQT